VTPPAGGGREDRQRPGGAVRPPAGSGPRRPGGARVRGAGRGTWRPPDSTGPAGPGSAGARAGRTRPGTGRPSRGRPPGDRARPPSGPARPPGPRAGRPGRPGAATGGGRRGPTRGGGVRHGTSPVRRLRICLLCFGFVLSLIAGRLIQLQGLNGAWYRQRAESNRLHTIGVPAERGTITTADGTILAMTVQTDTVTADPTQITGLTAAQTAALRGRVAAALSGPLAMPAATVLHLLDHPSSKHYVVIANGVSTAAVRRMTAALNRLSAVGIYFNPNYTRVYPDGDLAANLIGFTNTSANGDLAGQAGLEQSFNQLLAGRDGEEEVETSTAGQPIPVATDSVRPMVPGGDVRLTILSGLQWAAQQACQQQVKLVRADTCTVVVMRPQTGQILALAQYPGYQPANVTSLAATQDLPVSAVFPPGSTAKVVTAAAALEHGQTPMSAYTVPEQIMVDGFSFRDAEPHPTERLTLAGIVAHSSNVGMVQVVQHVSPQLQYQYYRAFGVGVPSGLPLPDTSAGILAPPSKWWGDQRYTLAFGQGVAATAVQMAGVYATIANGGVRVPPSIVAGTTGPGGRYVPASQPRGHRVIKASTAHQLMSILQQVPMLDATRALQPWGEIPGYSVAAKTGTAQVWDARAHCLCQYGASYIGIAPATDPQLVVAVNVQNPRKGDYFGNYVAGPVFYRVMKFALQALKIPPDHGKRPNVRLTAP
jgi:cell division protein FtsI (penicillin-binding protein 3)